MDTELTIAKLAEAAGVSIETIRYYQRRRLLDEPPKPLGGHRRYAPKQAKRVRFIKRAQALGFSLDEVRSVRCCSWMLRAHAQRREGWLSAN